MRCVAVAVGLVLVAAVLAGCGSDTTIVDKIPASSTTKPIGMTLTSSAFADRATIPTE